MKNVLLILALVLTGCSPTLVERLSSDRYWSNTKNPEPHISEHPMGVPDHFGVSKRLVIHNPLKIGIRAKVDCVSMFQADGWYHVNADSVRYILITAPVSREHSESCFLVKYHADNIFVPIEDQ